MTRRLAAAAGLSVVIGLAVRCAPSRPSGASRPAWGTSATTPMAGAGRPDPRLTPGAVNPRVTQANIDTTICRPGWTRTVRPPLSVTQPLKAQLMAAYHLAVAASAVELDHLVALEIGGSPSGAGDTRNLYPQLWDGPYGAHVKDRVENAANRAVCRRQMALAQAQAAMATDWYRLGQDLGVIAR